MASFYFITGGIGSSKNLIGSAFARRYNVSLLLGESFYNDNQLALACAGTSFDAAEAATWAQSMTAPLAATGGCVVVCRHLHGAELPIWQTLGTVHVIHTDPTPEETHSRIAAEQGIPQVMYAGILPNFAKPETVAMDIITLEGLINPELRAAAEKAREEVAYESWRDYYGKRHHGEILAQAQIRTW
jgi:gluconate kinase